MVAHFCEGVIEEAPVVVVHGNVGGLVDALLDCILKKTGCTNKSKASACAAHCGKEISCVRALGRHEDISDSLTGNGEGLTVGIANYCVIVVVGNVRHYRAAVNQLSVGLVCDDEYLVTNLCLLLFKDSGQLFDGILGENYACGVVGRVYDNCLCFFGKSGFKGVKVDLEVLFSALHNVKPCSRLFSEYLILREEGRKCDDLLTLVDNSVESDGEGRRRTAGHVDICGRRVARENSLDALSNSSSYAQITCGGGIAVERHGVSLGDETKECVCKLLRCGNAGVADAEVKDLIVADLGLSLLCVLKYFSDHGALFAQLHHFFVKHYDSHFQNKISPLYLAKNANRKAG